MVEDSASTRSFVRAILEDPSWLTGWLTGGSTGWLAGGSTGPETGGQQVGPIEVTEAQSGFDAMRLLPRARYDLIITDINMRDVNGLELISFIRKSELYRTTPLVIISTQATERDVERGRKLGADAYVAKPFTPEALRETCERLLRPPSPTPPLGAKTGGGRATDG